MTDYPLPPFDCAPSQRLSAHERASEIRQEALNRRLDRMERMMERLEKRLWITVYGVAAVILAQAFQGFLSVQLP
ncbi:GTA head formation protein, RCAP_rcc01685 family [Tritonibacter scottomollicae]|uniref:GTA head formation protein, RCAP_rcc01685 family n=1 Tax=Tritonibacter scottomollicae TaxID=483013 RepID=UPI003AA934FB